MGRWEPNQQRGEEKGSFVVAIAECDSDQGKATTKPSTGLLGGDR